MQIIALLKEVYMTYNGKALILSSFYLYYNENVNKGAYQLFKVVWTPVNTNMDKRIQ